MSYKPGKYVLLPQSPNEWANCFLPKHEAIYYILQLLYARLEEVSHPFPLNEHDWTANMIDLIERSNAAGEDQRPDILNRIKGWLYNQRIATSTSGFENGWNSAIRTFIGALNGDQFVTPLPIPPEPKYRLITEESETVDQRILDLTRRLEAVENELSALKYSRNIPVYLPDPV